jgi:predicted phosphohydrolase
MLLHLQTYNGRCWSWKRAGARSGRGRRVTIWALADLHASPIDPSTGEAEKPMDIFGEHWAGHMDRVETAWRACVAPDDTVILAGDIDWSLYLEDAMQTLQRIDGWPGTKLMLRGNHDYWWSSKATSRVRRALPPSIHALHNNAFQVEGFNVCGAKGSPVPGASDWSEHDAKLLNRESERLSLSLKERDSSLPTIVALHYPPFFPWHPETVFREQLEVNDVSACVYGHLHAASAEIAVSGCHGNVEYFLVACDAVGFTPVPVAKDGVVLSQAGALP